MSVEFGAQLKAFRLRARSSTMRDKTLSQASLARLLNEALQVHPPYETYSHVMISYWEHGDSHIDARQRSVLISLVKVLHNCGGIRSLEDANALLRAGGYLALTAEEINAINPDWARPRVVSRNLVGREEVLARLIGLLADPAALPIVAIDGLGGIGKTALMTECLNRPEVQKLFDHIVSLSAARDYLHGDTGLIFETVINAVGAIFNLSGWHQLEASERLAQLHRLLQANRVLIVLDNLETAAEAQSDIVHKLDRLLRESRSKALLTSRHRFKGELISFHLPGLEEASAVALIRQNAVMKNIQSIEMLTDDDLARIAHATGGSPLAIKFVVSQLDGMPFDMVLESLQRARQGGELEQDEYAVFYKGIYLTSWTLLAEPARRLLVAMAHFAPNAWVDTPAIREVSAQSSMAGDDLKLNLQQLWHRSFLEKAPTQRPARYSTHPLTQYFVLSDIVKVL